MENSKDPSPVPAGGPSAEEFVMEYLRSPARGNTLFVVTLTDIEDECAARGGDAFASGSETPSGIVEALVAKGTLLPLIPGSGVYRPADAPEMPVSAPAGKAPSSKYPGSAEGMGDGDSTFDEISTPDFLLDGSLSIEDEIPFIPHDHPDRPDECYFEDFPPIDPPDEAEIRAMEEFLAMEAEAFEGIADLPDVIGKPVDWAEELASWYGRVMMRADRASFDQSLADRAARLLGDMPRSAWRSLEDAGEVDTAAMWRALGDWGRWGKIAE